ncbi:hypothetical protein TREPR_1190 [Treponema primitia ZAS-2]|uniref:Uncharacterized protein n=1 Tax=Treponema primitia (strain ATCC BAA-887 / DSM 12427 / ZAS-2) TaxID=545694 RepID=F5YGT9_TREPZ|nr:hypothetical protein TREPR_1190 [Treponema primitia ZAS-2]
MFSSYSLLKTFWHLYVSQHCFNAFFINTLPGVTVTLSPESVNFPG